MECLCRLHNFLIDATDEPDIPAENTVVDNLNLVMNGAISVVEEERGNGTESIRVSVPNDLLDGGEHFDEVDRADLNRRVVRAGGGNEILPREMVLAHVSERNLRRPRPRTY